MKSWTTHQLPEERSGVPSVLRELQRNDRHSKPQRTDRKDNVPQNERTLRKWEEKAEDSVLQKHSLQCQGGGELFNVTVRILASRNGKPTNPTDNRGNT